MKKEERRFINGCFYLWMLCVVIKETYSIHFQKSKYSAGYAGSRCLPNETIFEIHDLSEAVQCSKVCFLSTECRSVFYHPDDHKCIGCSVSLGSCDVNLMAYPGSLAFDFDDTIYSTVLLIVFCIFSFKITTYIFTFNVFQLHVII
jgi:hypothetical protein